MKTAAKTAKPAAKTAAKPATRPLTSHEAFCLTNAAHFVAARGRTHSERTQAQFATLPEARAYATAIGDGRTMIYAVTDLGLSAHITNA